MQVQHESKKAFKFIIDREVEAPARFQSIQAYRCPPHAALPWALRASCALCLPVPYLVENTRRISHSLLQTPLRAIRALLPTSLSLMWHQEQSGIRVHTAAAALGACIVACLPAKGCPTQEAPPCDPPACVPTVQDAGCCSQACTSCLLPTSLNGSISARAQRSTSACRAAMALLRQEARFVDHLFAAGMVDEGEHEQLLKPIEKRERRMQRQGALWRVPLISEVGTRGGASLHCIKWVAGAQCSPWSASL